MYKKAKYLVKHLIFVPVNLSYFIISIIVIIASFHYWYYAPKTTYIDLRNRIVGARLLDSGHPPYFYKWQQGDDPKFFDFFDYKYPGTVYKVTATPFMLELHKPLANHEYSYITKLWNNIQIACLILMFLLFYFKTKESDKRLLTFLTCSIFFLSQFLGDHIYAGQIYLIYPFILLVTYLLASTKINIFQICSGFILGLFIFARPTFVLISIPLLFCKKYNIFIAGLCGFILGLIIAFHNSSLWLSYFEAMKHWENFTFNADLQSNIFLPVYLSTAIQNIVFATTGIKLFSYHLIFFFILFIASLLFILRYKISKLNIDNIFILGAFFIITADFFIPAPRYNYYAVQWIFPFFMIITNTKTPINKVHILLLTGLLICTVRTNSLLYLNMFVGEGLIIISIILYFLKIDILTSNKENLSK